MAQFGCQPPLSTMREVATRLSTDQNYNVDKETRRASIFQVKHCRFTTRPRIQFAYGMTGFERAKTSSFSTRSTSQPFITSSPSKTQKVLATISLLTTRTSTASMRNPVRAWALKATARSLWRYVGKTLDRKGWEQRPFLAMRSQLDPIKQVASTSKEHFWGIVNAVVPKVSNGLAEGLNSRIKATAIRNRGFRNKPRFANPINFHPGGLVFYPEGSPRWKPPSRSREELK